jgi:hypothetical protein
LAVFFVRFCLLCAAELETLDWIGLDGGFWVGILGVFYCGDGDGRPAGLEFLFSFYGYISTRYFAPATQPPVHCSSMIASVSSSSQHDESAAIKHVDITRPP